MGQIKVDSDQGPGFTFPDKFLSTSKCLAADVGILAYMSSESLTQMHLLIQAQALIKKNLLYELINKELNGLMVCQPVVFNYLPCRSTDYEEQEERYGQELPLLSFHRDLAISNLRFLSIFYASSPKSFALATNLIDRLLSKVAVPRKSLPIIATCCFYLAASYYGNWIDVDDLIKVTQCETTREIFNFVVGRIRDEVWIGQQPVTPVSLLELFYDVFALQDEMLQNESLKAFVIMRLETLLCHFRFMKFRYDILALTYLHHFVQRIRRMDSFKQHTILELQLYCRMEEEAYNECFGLVERFTHHYETQPTKQPRIKLNWTVSRRLLLKRRPSLMVNSSLDPVMEEEFPWEMNSSVPQLHASDMILSETSQGYMFWMDSATDSEEFESGNRRSSFEPQSQGNEEALTKADDDDDDTKDNSVISSGEEESSECQSEVIGKGVDDSVSVCVEGHFSDVHFDTNVRNLRNLLVAGDKSDFEESKPELRDNSQDNFVTSMVEGDQFEMNDKTVINSFVTVDDGDLNEPELVDGIQSDSVDSGDENGICEIQNEMTGNNLDDMSMRERVFGNDKSWGIHILLSDDESVRGSFESQAPRSQEISGKGESFDVSVVGEFEEVSFESHSMKRNEGALIKSLGSEIILLSDDNNNRVI